MKMLRDLFNQFRPLEVEDDFFGHLKYIRLPQDCISYWEATRLFTPTAREIELFVDAPAPELLPSELQRQFFLTVEQHYSRILVEVEAVLRPHFEEWARKPLSGPFSTEFTMTIILSWWRCGASIRRVFQLTGSAQVSSAEVRMVTGAIVSMARIGLRER